jgi:lipopolysaccharide export system permease protein
MTGRLRSYIAREVMSPFIISLGVLTFLLLISRALQLTELVLNKGVPVKYMFRLFVFIMPYFLIFTIPMSFLVAVLVAFSRFSSDHEVTAMKGSGLSLVQMSAPVFVISLFLWGVTTFTSVWGLPWGNMSFKYELFRLLKNSAMIGMKEGVFNDSVEGIVIYAQKIYEREDRMEGLLISDARDSTELRTISAASGRIISDPDNFTFSLVLENGSMHMLGGNLGEYHLLHFNLYSMKIDLGEEVAHSLRNLKGPDEMATIELFRKTARGRGDNPDYDRELTVLHKRLSFPFSCLIFALIGIPLGISSPRSGRSFAYPASVAILFAYYVLITAGETLGKKGLVHPGIGMWSANILFGSLGVFIFWKSATERPIVFIEKLGDAAEWLGGVLRARRQGRHG